MPNTGRRLPREFFGQSTLVVARKLIGMQLVHRVDQGLRIGRIVETEAYLGPRDLAAHSSVGETARNRVMFGPPGRAYVYLIYGIWHCFNVVTRPAGVPQAVLIRGLAPVRGLDRQKTWGPGLLCQAMAIDRTHNGVDLTGTELWIEKAASGGVRPVIDRAPRIGVDYAGEWAGRAFRFYDRHSPFVSTAVAARRKMLARAPSGFPIPAQNR